MRRGVVAVGGVITAVGLMAAGYLVGRASTDNDDDVPDWSSGAEATAPRTRTERQVPSTNVGTAPPPTEAQMSISGDEQLPAMPQQVEGYAADGEVQTERVRVFEGHGPATPEEFWSPTNSCGRRFWVARWRSTNDAVTVRAGRAHLELTDQVDEVDLEPPAFAGYLSGFHCQRPVLVFGDAGGGNGSTLVDVVIEWQYYEEAVETPPVTRG